MTQTSTDSWPTERAFLHSLSTPLATLGLELDFLVDILKHQKDLSEETIAAAARSQKALDRIYKLIQTRRSQLP